MACCLVILMLVSIFCTNNFMSLFCDVDKILLYPFCTVAKRFFVFVFCYFIWGMPNIVRRPILYLCLTPAPLPKYNVQPEWYFLFIYMQISSHIRSMQIQFQIYSGQLYVLDKALPMSAIWRSRDKYSTRRSWVLYFVSRSTFECYICHIASTHGSALSKPGVGGIFFTVYSALMYSLG